MELERFRPNELRLRVLEPDANDRYAPSADRLLTSVAKAAGSKAIGVILTGMGDDGVQGAKAIIQAGGTVIAENASTAVVYGMPGAAVRAGVVTQSLSIHEIADWLSTISS
jgi:two-component system chemotaxis response regulator CheB